MANLELKGIAKYFGASQALSNIYLTVEDGEFVSLVGPSGCGKTTLLRIIAGLETASEGDVVVAGQVVNDLDPAQRNISMVFQSYALYPHKSVFENIAFPLRMQAPWFTRIPIISHLFKARKTLEASLQKRVPQTADLMHLGELLKRKPRQLSGGQRQRVALARAMVRSPQLFLMDEPLSNLDAKLRADMRAEIIELQRRLGGTFIYVTHDQSEAMTMSDRVVLMQEGSIQQIGAPSELYDNPANLFVAEFIGSPKINTLAVQCPEAGELHGFENHLQGVPKYIDDTAVPVREPLSLCLRPESLRLLPTQTRDTFTGRIHILENLGNEFLVIVHPIGKTEESDRDAAKPMQLVARVAATVGRQLHPGDTVHLQPDWSQALLFNQDGFRLSQAVATTVREEVWV